MSLSMVCSQTVEQLLWYKDCLLRTRETNQLCFQVTCSVQHFVQSTLQHGGEGIIRLNVKSGLQYETIAPSVSLKELVVPLRLVNHHPLFFLK